MNTINLITKWTHLSDTAIVEEIGHMIQETRLQKNYSQSQLATMSGVSRATISQPGKIREGSGDIQVLMRLHR